MQLNEDQVQIQKWVHGFAEDVLRPAAHEWDEREEFPFEIVQQASEIGLYGWEFLMNAMGDSDRADAAGRRGRAVLGDAGLGMAIMGSSLAAAGIAGVGTPEQMMEWVPQCFGTADKVQLGAFCVSEPDAGSDVSSLRTRAVYDEANDEWVINGTKAWITNGGIADVHVVVAAVDPELRGRGQASFVIPPGTKGLSQGQKYKKHGIRASHTAEVVLDDVRVPGSLPARRQGATRRQARQGARDRIVRREAAGDVDLRGHPPDRRRPGARHRPRRLRVLARLRQGAQGVRQADHHEPGDRIQAGEDDHRDRRRPAADLARRLARRRTAGSRTPRAR